MKQQSGFTLIELIAVIVILGILAATAIPRFVDMSDAAEQAALDGVAGSLGSAMAMNYAAAVARSAGIVTAGNSEHIAITNCNQAGSILVGGALPGAAGTYTIASGAIATLGATAACTVSHSSGKTANFQGIGAP